MMNAPHKFLLSRFAPEDHLPVARQACAIPANDEPNTLGLPTSTTWRAGEGRVPLLAFLQRELLDRGEDDAAQLPRGQHFAELLPRFRLVGGLLEEILRRAELLVKLPVEIVEAIRHFQTTGGLGFSGCCRSFPA